MNYMNMVINEALRFQPPAVMTSYFMALDDVKAGNLTIYKGDSILFYIEGLHHNSKEWQRPGEFLP